jgi:hypothetical protein
MVLGFKTILNDKPTYFAEKIKACVDIFYAEHYVLKKHSIRHGKRWKAGDTIHMATGVRTKLYDQFNKGIVGLDEVISVQDIKIQTYKGVMLIAIDGRILNKFEVNELARNDGFDSTDDFYAYFSKENLDGQIIHWTDLRYGFFKSTIKKNDFITKIKQAIKVANSKEAPTIMNANLPPLKLIH